MAGVELTALEIDTRLKNADQTIAGLDAIKTHGKGAEDSFGGLAMKIAGFTSLANLAVSAGQKLVRTTIELAKQSVVLAAGFEKARVTWGVLVGDMDMGAKVFEEIRSYAAETPLSFEGLNQAATVVKGFGVAAEDIIPTLSKLGDVAMGDNQKLQSLALVYGQTMAQGKAKTQDLYQFINAGVPIFNLLAESMHVSAGEIKDLAAEGAITFEEIDKAITKATSAGGQFYKMMELTAETTEGKWSTAVDNFKNSLADLGERVLPIVNALLDDYNNAADRAQGVKNINTVMSGAGGDIEQAIKTTQAILNMAETDRVKFAVQYVGIFRNAAEEIANYKLILQSLLRLQEEASRGTFNLRDDKGDLRAAAASSSTALTPWQKSLQGITGDTSISDSISKITSEAGRLAEVAAITGGSLVDPFKEARQELVELYEAMYMTGNLGPEWSGKLLAAIDETDAAIAAAGESTTEWRSELENGLAPAGKNAVEVNEALASIYSDLDDRIKRVTATGLDFLSYEEEQYAAQVRAADGTQQDVDAIMDKVNALRALSEEQSAIEEFSRSLEKIGDVFRDAGMDAWVSTFETLGESLARGEFAADSFAESMRNIGESILANLPMLLLSAGLQAMIGPPPNIPLGLSLIGASGLVAIGSGIYSEYQSTQPATANALGGVYTSPSLHAYANGVYDSPRAFAFARGGVFAEAGPEAIMPLSRDSSGRLGVSASGSSGAISVQVINNLGVEADAQVSETTAADGTRQIQVMLEKVVVSTIASGKADGAMSGRYGAVPRGRRLVGS